MSITMNLNDNVWVKLTPVGIAAYKTWNENLGIKDPMPLKTEWDGYTKFQLWELMMIFGSSCHNGCHVPFETEIVLARS